MKFLVTIERDEEGFFVVECPSLSGCVSQGQTERNRRALAMVRQMDVEGFGNCTVTGSCEAVCPKEISLDFIAKMNREYGKAMLKGDAVAHGDAG